MNTGLWTGSSAAAKTADLPAAFQEAAMSAYQELLSRFCRESRNILGDNLTGVYLHGSLAMGCFHPKTSDLDLLVIVKKAVPPCEKRLFMDMVVSLNEEAPAKGIEMSIVRAQVLSPFVYPTPFELHFSVAHLSRYRKDPSRYIEEMQGSDPDLAAHFTILRQYGIVLCGDPVSSFLGDVPREAYLDSILGDIANAEEEVEDNPVYLTLNLCRVLAYVREGLILSKEGGGQWALSHLEEGYGPLLRSALSSYESGEKMEAGSLPLKAFARSVLSAVHEAV